MKFNVKFELKTVILASAGLAVMLNIVQFVDSALQRRDAFSPTWAYADKASTGSTATAAKTIPTHTAATPAPPAAPPAAAPADPVAIAAAKLSAAGLNPAYAALYLNVQARTGTPWQLLAAVHKTETNQAGDTSRGSSAGAVGPMQFMPATFAHYAADGDSNGTTTITDLDDAMLTAGRYLAAGGADKGQYSTALYHYNHSWSYVSHVTGITKKLGL